MAPPHRAFHSSVSGVRREDNRNWHGSTTPPLREPFGALFLRARPCYAALPWRLEEFHIEAWPEAHCRLAKTKIGHLLGPTSTHRSALLYRLKAHIRAHLADPKLCLATTAAALGISPRYVNDLLSDENTSFQRHVLTERLAHCERDLSSPMLAHRHVSEIAFAWGFNDLSHFGRVFREHYGMSPRDWRQSKLTH